MRMVHITESFAAGGIETTFLHVLRAFCAIDPTVEHEVVAFASGPLEAAYREVATVTVAPEWQAADVCLSTRADLFYVLFERCAYRVVPRLLAATDTPVVYGKGYDLGGMYRANEGLQWQADAALVAACSAATFTTAALQGAFGDAGAGATVLGKAADVSRFAAVPEPPAGAAPIVLCVANVHPRKRIGDLIDALALVRHRVPGARLRVAGACDASARDALQCQARAVGVADAVSLVGRVDDVASEMGSAWIVALPSSCEGTPTALIEAMASGRPVVATKTGHVESLLTDGVEGYLVEVGDVPAMAARLAQLLSDDAVRARMSRDARQRAAHHDVRRVAARLLGVLRSAAAGRGSVMKAGAA